MNKERLQKLADFLEQNVTDCQLNMHAWQCETAACALGWACRIPEFAEAGLELGIGGLPMFNDETGYFAGMGFFDITFDQSWWLFSSGCYQRDVHAKHVAARIRDLVETA